MATSLVMTETKPGEYVQPFLTLDPDAARQLMDELWRAGVRPSEHGSPGQLAAVERHLDDMRSISQRLLDNVLKDAIS